MTGGWRSMSRGPGAEGGAGGAAGDTSAADRVARGMVEALLPQGFPSDGRFALFGAMAPAAHVGGDYFDWFFTPAGRLMLVVADATGKGVPAAMFVAATRAVIRDLAMEGAWQTPAAILTRANRMLADANVGGMFATAVVAAVDVGTGGVVLASAGHPPPMVSRRGGSASVLALPRAGTVLGAMAEARFEDTHTRLEIGDRLVMYSDGVIEARRGNGEFLGMEGLARLCAADGTAGGAEAVCRTVLERVTVEQGGMLRDDATMLVYERRGG